MNTKIKIKARNVNELLKLLEKSGDTLCTLELDLEVSKSVIKILDNYCEDWDFADSKKETISPDPNTKLGDYKIPTPPNIPNSQHDQINGCGDNTEEEQQPQGTTYYTSSLCVKDYNSLATLVEAIFRLYKQSPNIKFESGLFYNTLEIEYNLVASSPISVEHSLIAMIIETYYNKATIREAIEDTVEKLRGLWLTKKLSDHPGVTSLTKVLYGGTK
jgi:hypothetical protein